jgi:Arc/MetJ-type ribon-helix-helix transcriptional regulator
LELIELSGKVPINISREIVDEIQRRVDESGGEFKTIEEYIEFILTEILRENDKEEIYTPEEEEEIKERLRRLGYIQ